jgi:hypothetical protein
MGVNLIHVHLNRCSWCCSMCYVIYELWWCVLEVPLLMLVLLKSKECRLVPTGRFMTGSPWHVLALVQMLRATREIFLFADTSELLVHWLRLQHRALTERSQWLEVVSGNLDVGSLCHVLLLLPARLKSSIRCWAWRDLQVAVKSHWYFFHQALEASPM